MKKIIMLLGVFYCLGLQVSAQAELTEETCAGGAGQVFIGNTDGKRYCMSTKEINWFTTYSWCERNGWTMPSWKTHCPNAERSESGELMKPTKCPNLAVNSELSPYIWLIDNDSKTHSVCINPWFNISNCARSNLSGTRLGLCAME